MMTFDGFKSVFLKSLDVFCEEKGCSYVEQECLKNNKKLHGIMIQNEDETEKENRIRPIFYLEDIYQSFCQKDDFSSRAFYLQIENLLEYSTDKNAIPISAIAVTFHNLFSNGFDALKDNIYPILINTHNNQELLSTCPHKEFLDMSIIYAANFENGCASVRIKNEMLENWGVSLDDIHNVAMKNLEHTNFVSQSLSEILGLPSGGLNLFYITNPEKIYGASSILLPEILKSVADKYNMKDLYILPSSVHEILVVPQEEAPSPQELLDIVCSINGDSHIMDPADILTDSVYEFNYQTNEITKFEPDKEFEENDVEQE